MALDHFEDDCPGCKPAILDAQTGEVLAPDHPAMVRIMAIWENTTLSQRRAYHRVMCLNSRDPLDLLVVEGIVTQLRDSPFSLN